MNYKKLLMTGVFSLVSLGVYASDPDSDLDSENTVIHSLKRKADMVEEQTAPDTKKHLSENFAMKAVFKSPMESVFNDQYLSMIILEYLAFAQEKNLTYVQAVNQLDLEARDPNCNLEQSSHKFLNAAQNAFLNSDKAVGHRSLFALAKTSKNIMPYAEKLRNIYSNFKFSNSDFLDNNPAEILNEIQNRPVTLSFKIKAKVMDHFFLMKGKSEKIFGYHDVKDRTEQFYNDQYSGYKWWSSFLNEDGFNHPLTRGDADLWDIVPFLTKFHNVSSLLIDGYCYGEQYDKIDLSEKEVARFNSQENWHHFLLKNPVHKLVISGIDTDEPNDDPGFTQNFGKMQSLENLTLTGYFDSKMIVSLYDRVKPLEYLKIDSGNFINNDDCGSSEALNYSLLFGKVEKFHINQYLFTENEALTDFQRKRILEMGTTLID